MATTITATCACARFSIKVDFPAASLPIDRALCLCTSCRRLSGSCGISYIALPPSQSIVPSQFGLTPYKTSEEVDRYFCSNCGAHVLFHNSKSGVWGLATGIWDQTEEVVKWTGCKWVEDTLDGGISVWLKEMVDPDGQRRELKRWMLKDRDGGKLVPREAFNTLSDGQRKKAHSDKLTAQCHCGGVKFYITRPNEDSKKAESHFPDLMVPFHLQSPANPHNVTWWLRENNTKYMAGTCTCRSCRVALGFEIQTWAFIPKCNVFKEDGTPIDFETGTMTSYESSKEIWREFCKVCGASIFWRCSSRPELVDISTGLFDPEQGARVEGWLDWWTGRVSFEEMAVSKCLAASLAAGLKASEEKSS